MKWVAIIVLALALCWVWRNQRRISRRLARAAGASKLGMTGGARHVGFTTSSAANTPVLVDAAKGADALPNCASENSICG